MANPEHLAKLKEGTKSWNRWRKAHREIIPNLTDAKLNYANLSRTNFLQADMRMAELTEVNLEQATLFGADLSGATLIKAELSGVEASKVRLVKTDLSHSNISGGNLSGANLNLAKLHNAALVEADLTAADITMTDLTGADLSNANLSQADLRGSDLSQANLDRADLSHANLRESILDEAALSHANLAYAKLGHAKLRKARLWFSNLGGSDFTGADLTGADLTGALLLRTQMTRAKLAGCRVYGISAWDVELEGSAQSNLVITRADQAVIQVDNLEVAQFIYLLLNNQKIRHVIDTITSKVVLILGRFSEERKPLLEAIREELRKHDYLPVLFDFEKPTNRGLTETVRTLAHLARFIVADITDAKSIPQELMAIVPNLPSVPIQPLLLASQHEYGMFEHFRKYPWVLEAVLYEDQAKLLAELQDKVILPAESKARTQTAK